MKKKKIKIKISIFYIIYKFIMIFISYLTRVLEAKLTRRPTDLLLFFFSLLKKKINK